MEVHLGIDEVNEEEHAPDRERKAPVNCQKSFLALPEKGACKAPVDPACCQKLDVHRHSWLDGGRVVALLATALLAHGPAA